MSGTAWGSDTSQITANEAEYQLKSAFIFNFMKFVEWPDLNGTQPQAGVKSQAKPLVIGIVGQNPFGKAFDAVAEKKIKNRPIKIVQIDGVNQFVEKNPQSGTMDAYRKASSDAIGGCHLLYVCRSEKNSVAELLKMLGDKPILTVSDNDNFVQAGGMIGLVMENNKIRFDIHLGIAESKKLKISSQLLNLARYVERDKPTPRK